MNNQPEQPKKGVLQRVKAEALPVIRKAGGMMQSASQKPEAPTSLPNASVVYGVTAALLFALGVLFIVQGRWGTGLLVFFPALCFLGFALYFIKYPK